MDYTKFEASILELIRRTSAYLPRDVQEVIELRRQLEKQGSLAETALDLVIKNINLAKRNSLPICQDTGTVTFYCKAPVGFNQIELLEVMKSAIANATAKGYLRQNSVDSLTGKNTGTNLGDGHPVVHFEQWMENRLDIRLILKGGGCENMSAQYKLPAEFNGQRFGRDLKGVRACILDAILQAQGKGCGPGFIGVCIGGDHAVGYEWAKHQLLRPVDDTNPIPELAALEAQIMNEANQLAIGPMGFGGNFTVGCCKIGVRNRLPASFFVSVAYMCWAHRRRGVTLDTAGNVIEWQYEFPGEFEAAKEYPGDFSIPTTGAGNLQTPLTEADVRRLKVGDMLRLNGTVFTGRDAVHKYLAEGGDLNIIKNGIIYHCGPVVLKAAGKYRVVAAGPTTSIREEPYQADVIEKFGIKAVIGKGGMGAKTLQACKKFGAVYLHAIGGAAQIYAQCVQEVAGVYLEQFGSPEAVWEFHVKDFPVVVTMDAHGNSLHQQIYDLSAQKFKAIL